MISILLDYSARCPMGYDMERRAPSLEEDFFEKITDTKSRIVDPIRLVFSQQIKKLNTRISPLDILKDIKDICDEIDDLGDYPHGYGRVRRFLYGLFDDNGNVNYNMPECSDEWPKGILGPIIDIMGGKESDWDWPTWAENGGYTNLGGKIKKATGKYKASIALVSVEYFEKIRTIVLYEPALGDPNDSRNENDWTGAFITGLFYAYHADARMVRANKTVLQSLASYVEYKVFETSPTGKVFELHREWETCDMKYWPYSGALYFLDIEVNKRMVSRKDYLFKRTFKKSLVNAKDSFDDLKALYRTYEGRAY